MCFFFFLMIRRPPRSTLFPYTTALPISVPHVVLTGAVVHPSDMHLVGRAALDRRKERPCTPNRSEEHTSELQSRSDLVCRLLLEKRNQPSGARAAPLGHTFHRPDQARLS